jgi:glycosyltransferase involved in cell wall biosynthesis
MLVNVTIPVFNEESRLTANFPALHRFLCESCRFPFELVIVDNGSTDRTFEIARSLSGAHESVRAIHLDEPGRGRAVKHAWGASTADLLTYMDIDLSADLGSFPALVAPLMDGDYDLSVGSRRLNPAMTVRSLKRELISRGYMLLVKALFQITFSDAQCGFKSITRRAACALLPFVRDNGWFMDTELLVLAERLGYRIFDLPVRWAEDSDSRVNILSTALHDVRGLVRIRRGLMAGAYPQARR